MNTILATFCILLSYFASSDAKYGDATYYNLGLTACGQSFTDNDLVAAVSPTLFIPNSNPNNDPICQRRAKVTDPSSGKSVIVQIKDKCPGCGKEDIDLSPAAFDKLRNRSVGRFKVNWDFI